MAVYKDNATGTWRVIYRFTNWKGERKQSPETRICYEEGSTGVGT